MQRDLENDLLVLLYDVARQMRTVTDQLARMFNDERHIHCDLEVVQLRGWKRAMWQDDAGLPWINTSPNMRNLNAAALYPGVGLVESAISVFVRLTAAS